MYTDWLCIRFGDTPFASSSYFFVFTTFGL